MKQLIQEDLYHYSCEGLRTLVMAERRVSPEEYSRFKKFYDDLMVSTGMSKEGKLMQLYDSMEQKLRYLGCTAIEDKL